MKRYYLLILCCFAMLANLSSIHANDEGQRAVIGSRGCDLVDLESAEDAESCAEENELVPQGLGRYLGPGSYHQIVFVSAGAQQVEMEDGSIWYLQASDRNKVLDWFPEDPVYITANTGWFAKYPFNVVNTVTDQRVGAHMQLGPFIQGDVAYTRWIVDIDYAKRLIRLNDGTEWNVSSMDARRFSKWLIEDVVIIGVNEGWGATWNPNLLINVNLLTPQKAHKSYVRASSTF